ncbi:Protein phosphatase 1, regulatory subunit, and related proteins [Phaffia rhodozyma]|uniref:Protein phosphatase 1, regulatory subunit, and related proteins n=1 Tax=Phaffia rhodozyma TaxID=264483 RepID=A0A0F7SGS3_PHARH|nr:Protein phosphatase 1, regulatory subunit, and related proteins [Phaffia rhodozyma]
MSEPLAGLKSLSLSDESGGPNNQLLSDAAAAQVDKTSDVKDSEREVVQQQNQPRARLVGPEIVQLPPGWSDDESEPEEEGGDEGARTEDRNMLTSLDDNTDDLELTHSSLDSEKLLELELPRFGPYLKRLCLRQNRITSLDESIFHHLTELEELDAYDNRVGVLKGLEKCPKLRILDLSFNLIRSLNPSSTDPPPLSAFTKLETVYFIQNKISLIEGLEGLGHSLRSLELGGNRIREIRGLDKLVNLEELWLGKNKIRKLENLETLTKLKILSLQSNRIIKLENLSSLKDLEEIYLSHNGVLQIEGLGDNKKLRVLDLGNNRIEKIQGLENCTELEEFWANNNKIPNLSTLSHLEKHSHLETVYLEHNPCQTNDQAGYRRKVILGLPQLKQVDATFVR